MARLLGIHRGEDWSSASSVSLLGGQLKWPRLGRTQRLCKGIGTYYKQAEVWSGQERNLPESSFNGLRWRTILFLLFAMKLCEWMSTWKHTPQRKVSFQWALASRVVGHHHTEPFSSRPQRLITASMAKVNTGEVSWTPSEAYESNDDGSWGESILTVYLSHGNISQKAGSGQKFLEFFRSLGGCIYWNK